MTKREAKKWVCRHVALMIGTHVSEGWPIPEVYNITEDLSAELQEAALKLAKELIQRGEGAPDVG